MRLEGSAPLDDCWGSWLLSLLPWVSFPSWCFFVWASSLLGLFILSWSPYICFSGLSLFFPFGPGSLFWASLTVIPFRPQQNSTPNLACFTNASATLLQEHLARQNSKQDKWEVWVSISLIRLPYRASLVEPWVRAWIIIIESPSKNLLGYQFWMQTS